MKREPCCRASYAEGYKNGLLEQVHSVNGWISIKEKMPPETTFRSIFIVTSYSHLKDKKFVEPLHYIGGKWFEMIHEEPFDESEYEITHWMPLPESPK